MCLIHVTALTTYQLEHLRRVRDAVDGAVLRMRRNEGTTLRAVHEPVHRFREDERPVSAEMDVGLLGGNQQEAGIGLRLQGREGRVLLVERAEESTAEFQF